MSNAVALGLTLGLLIAGSVFVWNRERVFLKVAKAHGSLPLLLRALPSPIPLFSAPLQQEDNTMTNTKTAPDFGLCSSCDGYGSINGIHAVCSSCGGTGLAAARRRCNAGSRIPADWRCDLPAGHTGYHTDGEHSWVGRERWRFAGREWTMDGVALYVWQLHNLDGTLNSSVVRPVAQLLAGWNFRYGVKL